jgi:hypothetical protein
MKLELLIREFREAIRGSEELEPNALANLNAAIDTAERRIIRKPQSQSPMTESSDRNSGGNEETEMEEDVIANVKTAGEVIGDLVGTLGNVIESKNGRAYVDGCCRDCGVDLPNDLFERCGRCLEARM